MSAIRQCQEGQKTIQVFIIRNGGLQGRRVGILDCGADLTFSSGPDDPRLPSTTHKVVEVHDGHAQDSRVVRTQ